jgi:hypothetical protein
MQLKRLRAQRSEPAVDLNSDSASDVSDQKCVAQVKFMEKRERREKREKVTAVVLPRFYN